jgi:hypothetical protein
MTALAEGVGVLCGPSADHGAGERSDGRAQPKHRGGRGALPGAVVISKQGGDRRTDGARVTDADTDPTQQQ